MTRSLEDMIRLLGGDLEASEKLGCGRSALSNWKRRGIPRARWVDLIFMLQELNLTPPVTLDDVRLANDMIIAPDDPPELVVIPEAADV